MSEFKVPYTKVVDIQPHPNPEVHSLEIVTIYGFQIVQRKNTLSIGQPVLFCPIDAILPKDLEDLIFPPDSKIKLNNSRVRQTRIQKFPSQGLILNEITIMNYLNQKGFSNIIFETERDYKDLLGITKFEPPERGVKFGQNSSKTPLTRKIVEHPQMHGYNGLENIKWFPNLFKEDEEVVIQNKFHGTSARAGMLPFLPITWIDKVKKFFNLAPKYQFRYGSNNVDITSKNGSYKGYYEDDIYGTSFKNCNTKDKILPNELIYGEIIGEGIQKGYHYGHKTPKFILFDVKIFNPDGSFKWLTPEEVEKYARERGFEYVTVLYTGKYSRSILDSLVTGADPYYPLHKVKEGIVIKSRNNYNDSNCPSGRRSLKYINPEYLDNKNNTDFH